jgi:hypothetical protein
MVSSISAKKIAKRRAYFPTAPSSRRRVIDKTFVSFVSTLARSVQKVLLPCRSAFGRVLRSNVSTWKAVYGIRPPGPPAIQGTAGTAFKWHDCIRLGTRRRMKPNSFAGTAPIYTIDLDVISGR